jgi:hypothetical protein
LRTTHPPRLVNAAVHSQSAEPPLPPIERLFRKFDALGLPVVYVGIPGRAGSICPACSWPLLILFGRGGYSLLCNGRCDEATVRAALGMAR